MSDGDMRAGDDGEQRVGVRLKAEREAQQLSLEDVSARTRVPKRHLIAIEEGDDTALPAPTYSAGFVKIYASVLGLDSADLAREFRREVERTPRERYIPEPFEPVDPARVPSRFLALTALAIAILLATGYAVWRGGYFGGDTAEERARLAAGTEPVAPSDATGNVPAPGTSAAVQPAPAVQPVVLTAIEPVWLRIYDGEDGPRLLEKNMAAGERFEVPVAARNPMLLTGRPQMVRVTVGTTAIPPLGDGKRSVSDLSLLPSALLARAAPAGAPAIPGVTPTSPAGAAPPS